VKLSPKEQAVIEILQVHGRVKSRDLARLAGVRPSSLRTIIWNLRRKTKLNITRIYGIGYTLEPKNEQVHTSHSD
jgi:DeoR/GlpR family transcriptional regulator of sugar metabolism